ncbi:hypothetical protein [Microtetraspora sp. NBRC 13810]|uniref:hypothetical protein n=1 Tax=Microtetraspora sp. NBRC 13810 TaxID=3030990 RepID=UPI002552FDB0|nr:hypothetical protein [Microtetraspora sp. NBRC 13810]
MKREDGDDATVRRLPPVGGSGAVDRYFALLQDRLPVWLHILHNLDHLVGKGRVSDNLLPIARAGIDYYVETLSAALPAFSSPTVTVRFREAVRGGRFGPMPEIVPLAEYLAAEQRAGRVAAGVDPTASARLMLAACFQHAYFELFTGGGFGPSRDEWAEEIVRELRLEPAAQRA